MVDRHATFFCLPWLPQSAIVQSVWVAVAVERGAFFQGTGQTGFSSFFGVGQPALERRITAAPSWLLRPMGEIVMIRVECPECGSWLNAKDKLAGKTRKCPKCGGELRIPALEGVQVDDLEQLTADDDSQAEDLVHDVLDHELPPVEAPQRLAWHDRYLICSSDKLFAAWESNGHGWMLKTNAGYIRAKRNMEELPNQGDFTLVELKMSAAEGSHRLEAVKSYQIASRWALPVLARSESEILSKVRGPSGLNKPQKAAVMRYLRESMMPEMWHTADKIIDYLGNTDYHSQCV
jgi:hypothetical protein